MGDFRRSHLSASLRNDFLHGLFFEVGSRSREFVSKLKRRNLFFLCISSILIYLFMRGPLRILISCIYAKFFLAALNTSTFSFTP